MDFFVQNAMKTQQEISAGSTDFEVSQATIKVIGVGGGGNNMVNWLYKKGIQGAEIIAVNTDAQHLGITDSDKKFLIGKDLTRGLGCGGFPNKGAEAAKESISTIKEHLKDADMVFICAGLGGGTGTGAAFAVANELISTMIKGIVETIAIPSLVNLDYADVRTIMTDGGVAAIGVGASD